MNKKRKKARKRFPKTGAIDTKRLARSLDTTRADKALAELRALSKD